MQNETETPEPTPQTIDKAENDAMIANERAKDEIDKLDEKGEEKSDD